MVTSILEDEAPKFCKKDEYIFFANHLQPFLTSEHESKKVVYVKE